MAKNITNASEEYVKLVKEVAEEIGIDRYVDFNVFDMAKSSKDVIKIKKTSVPMEVKLEGEDMIDVYLYEKAFDLVEDKDKRFWIENALSQVAYDLEKGKLIIGKEPVISVPEGMYDKYKEIAINEARLQILTLQQIADKEREEKERKKAEKKSKKQNKY